MSKIQLRRGTAAEWTSADPTLSSGEIGFETDTNKIKIGDGSTAWTSLAYFASNSVLNKYDATTAPTTGDDDGDGYSVGSVWIDVTADTPYICVDASTGAAVWIDISGGSDIAPIPTAYANLAALVAAQGAQTINYIYEVTDGSGFTGVDSGIVWVKYKGTTNGDETDYTWESRPSGGGSGSLEYQTEITTNTTFDGSQKGLNKVYPVNSTTAKTITITTGDYVANDVINIERRGQGSVEIIADTGVRIRGVRDTDNKFFINDPNSIVALICRGSEEFAIIGNLTRGYSGAVTTTSYTALQSSETADVTVIGAGFSSNMIVSISGNATLNSWTFVSKTEITLNITSSGTDGDFLTITYDNGDEFVDTNAITLTDDVTVYGTYPFAVGYALFKLKQTQTYSIRVRRSSDDAETDVGFNSSGKIALDSPISSGGTFTAWAGSDDVYIKTFYNQGSFDSTFDLTQSTSTKQTKILDSGTLISQDSLTLCEFDGTDDGYITTGDYDWHNGDLTVVNNVRAKSLQNGAVLASYLDSTNKPFWVRVQNATSKMQFNTSSDGTSGASGAVSGVVSTDTNYKCFSYKNDSLRQIYLNGSAGTSEAASVDVETYETKLTLGYIESGSAWYLDGYVSYAIYYESDESANRIAIQGLIDNFL